MPCPVCFGLYDRSDQRCRHCVKANYQACVKFAHWEARQLEKIMFEQKKLIDAQRKAGLI